MELTNRRFAIFLVSGLSLAVLVGVLVWKVSDAGVNLSGQKTEIAGQPVAAADADEQSGRNTAVSAEMSSTAENGGDDRTEAESAGSGDGADAGAAYDPLAPRNANLGGARGGSEETSYYRPTNAAPAPQGMRTSAPAQTQQPGSGGHASEEPTYSPDKTTKSKSTTAVPQAPEEPQRPDQGDSGGTPAPDAEPQKAAEEAKAAPGAKIDSEIAEKAIDAGKAAIGAQGDKDDGAKRPEDPFSASTRVPDAPAGDNGAAPRD